jgi:hypothetical protein
LNSKFISRLKEGLSKKSLDMYPVCGSSLLSNFFMAEVMNFAFVYINLKDLGSKHFNYLRFPI